MKKLFVVLSLFVMTSTAFAALNCDQEIAKAQELKLRDATVDDEIQFFTHAENAIVACSHRASSRNVRGLSTSIASMKKHCDNTASQGLSQLYLATCYLKLAELSQFIIN